jgi:hypothetical protein
MLADTPSIHADPVTPDLAFGFGSGVPLPDGSPLSDQSRLWIRAMLAERFVVFRNLLARQYDRVTSLPGC